jgi:predicted nuclease with TOPRIM domain
MTLELDKKAEEYARKHSSAPDKETPDWIVADFKAGYNSRDKEVEHLQSENARISEEHNKLADKYLKLSADYADLYERRKTIEQVQTPGK